METKQHATKKSNGSTRKSKGKLNNTLRQMIMKIQPFRIYGMPQKQFLKESSYDTGLLQERRKISNQLLNLTHKLEKLEQIKHKVSRSKEIINNREEINKIEIQKKGKKINKTKTYFIERINKIDKPLARLTKKRIEKTQINKIRNKNGKSQCILWKYKNP